ncbi:MAG: AI-2E family transporter [Solobacterium sp.]|nr:AI-2E family transporter [Solobacterium sp.]
MNRIKDLLEKRWFANLAAVCGGVLLYMVLTHFAEIFSWMSGVVKIFEPVLAGIIMAYLLEPAVRFFEQKVFTTVPESRARMLSVTSAFVCLLLIIIGAFGIIIPAVVSSVSSLVSVMSEESAIDNLINSLNKLGMDLHLDLTMLTSYLDQGVDVIVDYIKDNASQIVNTTINIGNTIVNIVIGLIIALYLLLDKKRIMGSVAEFRQALLSQETFNKHNAFLLRCHEILISYIGCNLLDGLIVGVINAIVMMMLGIPYIALVSVVVGVTNLLPTFGPIIGAVIGSVILVFDSPMNALYFLILTIILQTIDGYFIKPKMFGNTLGIPAVLTLISTIILGKIYGAAGILLAVPAMAIVMFLYREHFLPWLGKRNDRLKN